MKWSSASSWLGLVFLPPSFSFQPTKVPALRLLRHPSLIGSDPSLVGSDRPYRRSNLLWLASTLGPNDHRVQKRSLSDTNKLEWLQQATDRIVLQTVPGCLTGGKWHEVLSLLKAWSSFQKSFDQSAARMESLLKVLIDEQRAGNTDVIVSMTLYNHVLDAWACAALFGTMEYPELASQRAREILVSVQEAYEHEEKASRDRLGGNDNNETTRAVDSARLTVLKPNAKSFNLVLHAVRKAEGVVVARRVLAWMEYLYKSGKNTDAKPRRSDYLQILDAYAKETSATAQPHSGILTEAFLRHIKYQQRGVPDSEIPDTVCYNIVIRAWSRQRRGRESAEHADRLLEEMKATNSATCQPNEMTYGSVISAWAASGMKSHAVRRVEELLREVEDSDVLGTNTVILNAVMSAWVKSKNPAAVCRTEEILRQMEASMHAKPDLISYNTHLHALSTHSSAARPGLAARAEELLQKLEQRYGSGDLTFRPNLFTYNLAMEAARRVQDSTSEIRSTRLLQQLIEREDVEPDTFSFNQVLSILSKSRREGSAARAERLLRYMDAGVHESARPNAASFASVIATHAIRGNREAAERCEFLLGEMKRRSANGDFSLKPTRACYNSIIDCWARSGEGTYGARKAESLLQEMIDMFDAGDLEVSPNIMTFNAVLNAWAQSGTRCCGYQAEKYLDQMWTLYNAGNNGVKPNDFSYNTVINAISKSKNEEKGQKALRILRRMDKLYQADNSGAKPNEITYTAVINSCAFPSVPDSRTRRKALDTAMFTLKELQGSGYGQPNQVTYGTFIRACANLLHDDKEMRRVIMKRVFEQCCEDGQVGEMVLNYTPRDLREELLADYVRSNGKVSLQDLPLEWRCNVDEKSKWREKRQVSSEKERIRRSCKS